jgi:hypothetical protein
MQHVSPTTGNYNRCGIISQNLKVYQRYCEVFKSRKFKNFNTKHEMHAKRWEKTDVKFSISLNDGTTLQRKEENKTS